MGFLVSNIRRNCCFDRSSSWITTAGSIISHKREAEASEEASEKYKSEAAHSIADANLKGELAKAEAVKASERVAVLNKDAARLTAENLALQTVLLPRHVGLIGIDEEPKAKIWFAGFERWAGTKLLIQVIPNDPEAQNLANEIATACLINGWKLEQITETRSGVSLNLVEGISVFSPSSYKFWDPENKEQQEYARLSEASISLAVALTKAGLGVGPYPVSGVHGLSMVVDFPAGSEGELHNPFRNFSPKLDGVYVQIGSRPVASTVAWIKQGRPNDLGIMPADAGPTETHK